MLNLNSPNFVAQAPIFLLALAGLTILVAAIYDSKTFTIPHIFPALLIGLFGLTAIFTGLSLAGWGWHILSALLGFSVGLLLYVLGPMGGGDVKLFSAMALWVTPSGLLGLSLFVSLAGLIIAFAALIFVTLRERFQGNSVGSWNSAYLKARKTRIPYGPALAIGAVIFALI